MRGFGTNQSHFAIEGVMGILAERIGMDGWEIRSRNILNPGDRFATGQVMRDSVRGLRESLEAVKTIYRNAKYAGVSCGIKSTGIGNGTTEEGRVVIRVLDGEHLEILNGYTEMGQGLYTATMQAVCEETGLPDTIMSVRWDKELGAICGETWASRATTLSCAAAQKAARQLAEDLKTSSLGELAGREYTGSVVYSFTTKPGTPEAAKDPTTHFTFSYSTQVVILDEEGQLARVVAAHDVGRAINPRLCAEQMEGGVHMGLGYALSEDFPTTDGQPHSLKMRDFGLVPAKYMPPVDIILIEVPDEFGGYGAKGVGEIGCVATAGAVAAALHSYDGIRRFKLPMDDAKAAEPILPKSRNRVRVR
jgi:xanthine dehydrogenase molybdenum-binding subunit